MPARSDRRIEPVPGQPPPGPPATVVGRAAPGRAAFWGRVWRYAAGSVVATACSEAVFLLLYGVVAATPAVAATVGWLAGAVPNYWLNRSWTWRQRGRPSFKREVLPYVAIILGTLVLAVAATSWVDAALTDDEAATGLRVGLVGATFLAVYAAVFVLRFFLLDRLFHDPRRRPVDRSATDSPPETG